MTEEVRMNQDREVNINWLRINVPQVAAIAIVGVTIVSYVTGLSGDVRKIEEARATNRELLNKDLDNIKRQLDAVANAPLRIDMLEKNLNATNQRMDTYLQTLGNKIDGVSDRVGGLSTKIEVLSQKVEAITPTETRRRTSP